MHNISKTHCKTGKRFASVAAFILVVTILIQTLSFSCFAIAGAFDYGSIGNPILSGSSNGVSYFDSDATVAELKKQLLQSMNQDLLMKIEDYELTGEVDVILTFSDGDLITRYTDGYAGKMTYGEFLNSSAASKFRNELKNNQNRILNTLEERGLVSNVKYNYFNILDGAFVTTTYEQLEDICSIEGVQRVTLSNTYEPAVAVENPVNVYDTGIFNSSDISYTGKGTLVAVLDTGCDYTHSAFTTHVVDSPAYSRETLEGILENTVAYALNGGLETREVYYGNITNDKIFFGYDYADKDPDIMPFINNHGTHVAGIIAGKDDVITGVAIDAQLAIMKVFSDYEEGSKDGDIMAALEDCIVLGVDAINMSLGSSSGFTREVDDEYKNGLYDRIADAGISLLAAASNDHSSAYGSEQSNTNKTSNPDSGILGTPSTFDAAMSVASINGNKDKYMLANGDHEVFFHESSNQSAKEYDFYAMLGIEEGMTSSFEYVTVPGVGMTINYAGLDMDGKIALVRRGDISFEEKVQYAHEAGAVAVIIYNNIPGDIIMTIGNNAKIPAISIGKDDGERLASRESGTLVFDLANVAGPFMSDFSSWGPSPDLTLKPEITAHGGNILSAIPGGGYDKLSGTSMATPNMCGITVLIRQYVKENFPEIKNDPVKVKDLVNQLCMSTATIAMDQKNNPYSPRKQGAGIADILKATTTKAYLYVDGIGKTKLELKDDPTRLGVYEMTINLKNISDTALSYRLGNITMTETVSSSDPEYVAEMGYLLSNLSEYSVSGGTLTDGVVTVGAGETAKVTVKITLSAEDKAYLNSNFKNGMYVEGFLTFDNLDANGVDLNAPFLAFYGDWAEAPIFDLDYYEVETEAHDNAIDDDDKIKADYYATTPMGSYYYDYIVPLGSFLYKIDESEYPAIPATVEKAAVSYYEECISGIYGVFTGLLRAAKEMQITITDAVTGEVVWTDTQYDCAKAHYYGQPVPYYSRLQLAMADYETGEVFGYNNQKFEVTMSAKLDWSDGIRNSVDTYSFSFYIDYQPPTVTDATFRTVYDKSRKENRYYVDMMIYDNHYAMSVRPIVVYGYANEDGEDSKTYSILDDYPIPIYQQNIGEATKVTMEITDYMDQIRSSDMKEGVTVYIDDYALNSAICYIPFPEVENSNLEFKDPTSKQPVSKLDLQINETRDLTTYLTYEGLEGEIETEYLKNLTWASSDPSVVAIHQGQIEAKKTGTATVTVTGDTWTETDKGQQKQIYKQIVVNVGETEMDNPNSAANVKIKSLAFTSYYTVFAFNNDIDFSEIGVTNSTNYFGNSSELSCYPSEQIRLNYTLKPWNLDPDRYTLKWKSSNPKVATVDENGLVTALKEGKAHISLEVTFRDGQTSLLTARCTVNVKSEFIIENRTLVAYKGAGGKVEIPDDEGIITIGAYAFSHFNLDNTAPVEKDEDGYYDFDEKKTPIGNRTVTSVLIPEGVETIEKYAFYNCSILNEVVLPESCKTINASAFEGCPRLVNINMENVQSVADCAFYKCESLTGINLSHVSAIGKYAFSETRLTDADLSNLSYSGEGAFYNCTRLATVTLGKKTRIAKYMFANTAIANVVAYCDSIPDAAFNGCEKLTSVTMVNDLTYLGEEAFSGCEKLKTVVFGGICEEIAYAAFYDCSALKTFTLPNCSVVIGEAAFADTGLTSLVFGENTRIEIVGGGVFDSVEGMTVNITASDAYVMENGILYNSDKSKIILALPDANLGAFVVPATVREIGNGAFSSCIKLTSISFAPDSVLESIGVGAFAYCNSLASVTLPDRNVKIGSYAFYNDAKLKQINLQNVSAVGELAFSGTSITNAELSKTDVVIGAGAFYNCAFLGSVTLGDNAVIEDGAFSSCVNLTSVTFKGDGVTVGYASFMGCAKLAYFDFSKLTGKVGDMAFAECASLTSVVMPYVTEIGEGCFAGCPNIKTLDAALLEVIGASAFSPTSEDAVSGAIFVTVNLPSLRVVGDGAFYGCIYLQSIDLSKVESIGVSAFAVCSSLKTVTLSDTLTVIPEGAFQYCSSLTDIDLSHIVEFGMGAMYCAKLPSHLDLPSVQTIGSLAFVEEEGKNYLESVDAPNLTYVAEQAFVGCLELTEVNAPKVEYIGYSAFAYTAIEEMEISGSLEKVEFGVFEGDLSFKGFYVMVDDEKVDDYESDTIMIKDGVLYTVKEKGYELTVYPSGKTDSEFTVADGTVRIGYTAAMENDYLEKVILPESLRSISNFAFYDCDNLKTVVFKSYYAPVLEGTATGGTISITPDTVDSFPGFDELYRYDYYYAFAGEVGIPFYYSTFIDVVGSAGASGLTYVIPDNCERYDSLIYTAYFDPAEETSGKTVGKYAVAFIDAANKLPATVDRFDKKLVDAAINAYNALEGHSEEMVDVDQDLINRFREARTQYNVSVAENKIDHIFDLDRSEYAFELVKDARATFLALTENEQAMVDNADKLSDKIEELAAVMGMQPDFTLSFAEHYPTAIDPEPPVDDPNDGLKAWQIALIVVGSVLVVGGIGFGAFMIVKNRKASKADKDPDTEPETENKDNKDEEERSE